MADFQDSNMDAQTTERPYPSERARGRSRNRNARSAFRGNTERRSYRRGNTQSTDGRMNYPIAIYEEKPDGTLEFIQESVHGQPHIDSRGRGYRQRGQRSRRAQGNAHRSSRNTESECTNIMDSSDTGASVMDINTESSIQGSGNALQTTYKSQTRPKKRFGEKLKEWILPDLHPDVLVLEILSSKYEIKSFLKGNNWQTRGMIVHFLHAVARVCMSNKKSSLMELLRHLIDEDNLTNIMVTFLSMLQIEESSMSDEDLRTIILNMCCIAKSILQRFQTEIHLVPCNIVIMSLESFMNSRRGTEINNSDIMEEIRNMKEIVVTIQKEKEALARASKEQKKIIYYRKMEDMKPPDSFRELPILPCLNDLHLNEKPFLRANKTHGGYDDLEHYLDVQFRLLREDYVQPLRKGIYEYRKEIEQGSMSKKYQDIRLYENVQIIRPVCENSGIHHEIQFSTEKLKKVNWSFSRRFLFGSLLCLTNDNFENIIFATVANRDEKALEQGFLQVKFQKDDSMILNLDSNVRFVMAETTAYFESYRHILRGLQETETEFPLQKYIVECKTTMKPPKYLLGCVKNYDFKPLLSPNDDVYSVLSSQQSWSSPALNTRSWPSAKAMHLDDSQYAALQLAVTKEFALIQGPPGTGKTFIGLKIVRLLLHNHKIWKTNEKVAPILVVCYTNHALDQFLTEISTFTTDIVRIGGRCSCEELNAFKLSNLRRILKGSKQLSRPVFQRKTECIREMKACKSEIQRVSLKLKATKQGLLKISAIRHYIDDDHLTSLESRSYISDSKENEMILEWLGIEGFRIDDDVKVANANSDIETNENRGPMTEVEAGNIGNVWSLRLSERVSLYRLWLALYQEDLKRQIIKTMEICQNLQQTFTMDASTHLQRNEYDMKILTQKLHYSQQSILDENRLSSTLQKALPSHFHSLMSRPTPSFMRGSTISVIDEWLCIDGSKECKEIANEHVLGDHCISLSPGDVIESDRFEAGEYDEDEEFTKIENVKEDLTDLLITVESASKSNKSIDSEGWTKMVSKRTMKNQISEIVNDNNAIISENEAKRMNNLWIIPKPDRVRLYKFWVSRYQKDLRERIRATEEQYSKVCECYQEALDSEDVEVMSGAKVIGMTTTGAAKYRNILQSIKPKIIIVEEAAEVLESHIVTAINPECQHLILIGDHKQLRPTPTVYQLAVHYNLEISLFERMIKNDINFATLKIQHRMRPEISKLVKFIYPDLLDHAIVHEYPNVPGVKQNMFFINHSEPEKSHDETKSHSNDHEARFIPKLCKYIMQQGYKPAQITVLTTYTGQVLAIRKQMPKNQFEGIRITSVDNFQGEENDVILLSLVRSNSHGNIGFLKTENRICVALSRAKHGLYVIGNFDILESNSDLWRNIVSFLRSTDAIGDGITLRCKNHPHIETRVSKETDFFLVPEGGCNLLCNAKLKCGHTCEQVCHVQDSDHHIYKCLKPCQKKVCSLNHICKKKCFQECGPCKEPMKKIVPHCGHENSVPCHMDPKDWKCQLVCNRDLSCGHKCKGVCGSCHKFGEHEGLCNELREVTLPCGHLITTQCHKSREKHICRTPCQMTLMCGHQCKGNCGDCHQGRLHIPCQSVCGNILVCGHKCQQKCCEGCPPCRKKCIQKCSHDRCKELCRNECVHCSNDCSISCKHEKCSKTCNEPCDRKPCLARCDEKLPCGHNCLGLCGEKCPSLCQVCNKDDVLKVWDIESPVMFVALEECNHIFDASYLDAYMSIETDINETSVLIGKKLCPVCDVPIMNNTRYRNILKMTSDDVDIVKGKLRDHWDDKDSNTGEKWKLKQFILKYGLNAQRIQARLEEGKISNHTLDQIRNQLEILKKLASITKRIDTLKDTSNKSDLKETYKSLIQWTFDCKDLQRSKGLYEMRTKKRTSFSRQELSDVQTEFLRIEHLIAYVKFIDILEQTEGEGIEQYEQVKHIVSDLRKRGWNEDVANKLKRNAANMNILFGLDCFHLDDINPIDLIQPCVMAKYGNWHKCNNGHISYTEDGISKKKCPSCDLVIQIAKAEQKISIPLFITRKTLRQTKGAREQGEAGTDKGWQLVTKDQTVVENMDKDTGGNDVNSDKSRGKEPVENQNRSSESQMSFRCSNGHICECSIKDLPDKCSVCDSTSFASASKRQRDSALKTRDKGRQEADIFAPRDLNEMASSYGSMDKLSSEHLTASGGAKVKTVGLEKRKSTVSGLSRECRVNNEKLNREGNTEKIHPEVIECTSKEEIHSEVSECTGTEEIHSEVSECATTDEIQ